MPGGKRITLKEIARRADTSTMAVSVVLNGARSNTRVSEATRRRITEITKSLKYSPNAMAQGLKRQRNYTLGVLFEWAGTHTIHNLYSAAVLDGIVGGAAEAGYHVLLYTTPWKDAAASSPGFSDQRTDGVIVVAPSEHSDVVSGLVGLEIPVAVLSSFTEVAGVPYVAIDNCAGVTLALEHLRTLGHKRIAFAGQGRGRTSMRERHDTFLAWMNEHDLPVPDEHVLRDFYPGTPGNAEKLQQLLCLPNRPTAIFAVTDDIASEVLEAARTVGVTVPEQLSVVGFDDVLLASLTVPKLTTVRLPLVEMGHQVADLLIELIEERRASSNHVHIAAPELIVRASTAVAPTLRS